MLKYVLLFLPVLLQSQNNCQLSKEIKGSVLDSNSTININNISCLDDSQNKSIWYKFDVLGDSINIQIHPITFADFDAELFRGDCLSPVFCISSEGMGKAENVTLKAQRQTYYLQVFAPYRDTGRFEVSLKQTYKPEALIFPNPTMGEIQVSNDVKKYSFWSVNGVEIGTDLLNVSSGLYIARLLLINGEIIFHKIVKI